MLDSFRSMALHFLYEKLEKNKKEELSEQDLFQWFQEKRKNDFMALFPYLIEDTEKIECYYTLRADSDNASKAILERYEAKESDKAKITFVKPTGSQSPAVGPVIKRTYSAQKSPGPTEKIQATTLAYFESLASSGESYSAYFQSVVDTFSRPMLQYGGSVYGPKADKNALNLAIEQIQEKKTVLLVFQDKEGLLPGESKEYCTYLQNYMVSGKYSSEKIPAKKHQICPLCQTKDITLYPNAVKGAGMNWSNADRIGVFPSIQESNVWKKFSLCLDCADLLYIYKNHVAKHFQTDIAGSKALVIPYLHGDRQFLYFQKLQEILPTSGGKKQEKKKYDQIFLSEKQILRKLCEEKAVSGMDILWAEFGQNIEKVQGIIPDILPSRLAKLCQIMGDLNTRRTSPFFPEHPLIEKYVPELSFLGQLFKRPGGKKSQKANDSKLLFLLRRELAEAIYHKKYGLPKRFWEEVWDTARWYLKNAENAYYVLYEGYNPKKNTTYWTLAGWIRHLAEFLNYLKEVEVLPMTKNVYQVECNFLKPYFIESSGLNTPEKAFAFLLGVLYGRLLSIQAAKGVNVASNALTWLKRLNLTGSDLPELYNKIREKLLVYEAEKSSAIRELIVELGKLGIQIGSKVSLDQTNTCYFLLLGQSLSTTILSTQKQEERNSND